MSQDSNQHINIKLKTQIGGEQQMADHGQNRYSQRSSNSSPAHSAIASLRAAGERSRYEREHSGAAGQEGRLSRGDGHSSNKANGYTYEGSSGHHHLNIQHPSHGSRSNSGRGASPLNREELFQDQNQYGDEENEYENLKARVSDNNSGQAPMDEGQDDEASSGGGSANPSSVRLNFQDQYERAEKSDDEEEVEREPSSHLDGHFQKRYDQNSMFDDIMLAGSEDSKNSGFNEDVMLQQQKRASGGTKNTGYNSGGSQQEDEDEEFIQPIVSIEPIGHIRGISPGAESEEGENEEGDNDQSSRRSGEGRERPTEGRDQSRSRSDVEDLEQNSIRRTHRSDSEDPSPLNVKVDGQEGSLAYIQPEDNGSNQGDNLDNVSMDSAEKLQHHLNEINESCIESLKNEDTDAALDALKRAEQILEDITNEGKDVDRNMIIIILYNQACCYQRMSMLDECSNYLDGTIYNLQQKIISFEEQDQEIKDMMSQADNDYGYGSGMNRRNGSAKQNDYGGYGAGGDFSNQSDYDQYGLLKGVSSVPYGSSQSKQNQNNDQSDDEDSSSYDQTLESSKKLCISQKLFKMRYLGKCHLQLCAVQSQLNKHKDALYHGQMASIYCQELIINTKVLCESYIGEILKRGQRAKNNADEDKTEKKDNFDDDHKEESPAQVERDVDAIKSQDSDKSEGGDQKSQKKEKKKLNELDKIKIKLNENYYLEDDKKLLDFLINNCHPILSDMAKQVTNFNKYNDIFKDNSEWRQSFQSRGGRSMQQEFASEFEQELRQLIETKSQFSIIKETRSNVLEFENYEEKIKEQGFDTNRMLNRSYSNKNMFSGDEQQEMKKTQQNRINFQRQFVDEAAPLAHTQNQKQNQWEENYYKNNDLSNSFTSEETYGGQKYAASSSGSQSYFHLRRNVKTILVAQEEDDWIFNLNIGNVMHLQPLSTEEMNLHVDNSHELSRDAMLGKIILLTVSYFCVGTELRFLNNSASLGEDKDKSGEIERLKKLKKGQSEMWHAQALEASTRFLPSECPLVAHVITNYQKHHSPALTTIPEDAPLDEDLKVIRPLNEVKNDNINYHQIIRNHLKPERLPPLSMRKEAKKPKKKLGDFKKSQQQHDDLLKLKSNHDSVSVEQKSLISMKVEETGKNEEGHVLDSDRFNRSQQQSVTQMTQNTMNTVIGSISNDNDINALKQMQSTKNKLSPSKAQIQAAQHKIQTNLGIQKKKPGMKSTSNLQNKTPMRQSLNTKSYGQIAHQGKIKIPTKQSSQRSSKGLKKTKGSTQNLNGQTTGNADKHFQSYKNLSLREQITQNSNESQAANASAGANMHQRAKMTLPGNKSTKVLKNEKSKRPTLQQTLQPSKNRGTVPNSLKPPPNSMMPHSTKNARVPISNMKGGAYSYQNQMAVLKDHTGRMQYVRISPNGASPQSRVSNPGSELNAFDSARASQKTLSGGQYKLGTAQSYKKLGQQYYNQQSRHSSNQRSDHGSIGSQKQNFSKMAEQNKLSIAQNIQKITQVLSQKFSSYTQSQQKPEQNLDKSGKKPKSNKGKSKSKSKSKKENSEESVAQDTDEHNNDDGESSEGENANFDITSDNDKHNNANQQLHNVPKVSSSNLMIKSKTSMNFKNMQSLQNRMSPSKLTVQNGQLKYFQHGAEIGSGQGRVGAPGSLTRVPLYHTQSQLNREKLILKNLQQPVMKSKNNQSNGTVKIKASQNYSTQSQLGGQKRPAFGRVQMGQNTMSSKQLMPNQAMGGQVQNNYTTKSQTFQQRNQQLQQQILQQRQIASSTNHPQYSKKQPPKTGGAGTWQQTWNVSEIQQIHQKQAQQQQQQQNSITQNQNQTQNNQSYSQSGHDNTNCNVTVSLNNISVSNDNIANNVNQAAMQGPGPGGHIQNIQRNTEQEQQMKRRMSSSNQINQLPSSSQKFSYPMRNNMMNFIQKK